MKILRSFTSFKKIDLIVGMIIFLTAGILYLYYAINANLDLVEGKHVLFMDEQIVYDGVDHILNSENTGDFIKNITYNGDHRYGKILFNVNALVSAIPKSIWGESGQIIAIRLLQTLFLLVAYFIVSITFLKHWITRSLLFFFLLTLTCTSYYFTMPKPEPLQILFIALFFYFAEKKKFKFGLHWIFMGLAIGTKISAFPIIAFYLLLSLYQERKSLKEGILIGKKIFKSLIAFLVGWIIAEPMIVFGNWQLYLNSTWQNTTHGADDSSVTVLSWIKLIISDSSMLFMSVLIIGVLLCVLILLYWSIKLLTKKDVICKAYFDDKKYLIIISGFLLLLFYMLKVDRLWNFYLQIPFIFIVTGVFIFVEKFFYEGNGLKKSKSLLLIILLPLLSYFLVNAINTDRLEYSKLSTRTSKPRHIRKSAEFNYLTETLKDISIKNNKLLKVYYDPQLYLLSVNEFYEPEPFWGYFLNWQDQYDVVIYYPNHGEQLKDANLPTTNIRYDSWKKAIVLYDEFISEDVNSDGLWHGTLSDTKNIKQKNGTWVTLGDWKYSNGILSKVTSDHLEVRQAGIGLKKDKTYLLEFEITSHESGGLFFKFGGGASKPLNDFSLKKHSITVVDDGNLDNFQLGGSFIGALQNISLTEIINVDSNNQPNLLGNSDESSEMRIYFKLSDESMPENLRVYLRSDIYSNYKKKR